MLVCIDFLSSILLSYNKQLEIWLQSIYNSRWSAQIQWAQKPLQCLAVLDQGQCSACQSGKCA